MLDRRFIRGMSGDEPPSEEIGRARRAHVRKLSMLKRGMAWIADRSQLMAHSSQLL
jgi:hypothetical protein